MDTSARSLTRVTVRVLLVFSVLATAAHGQYYTMTTVAGVDFAAGQVAKATALYLESAYRLSVDQQTNLYIADYWGWRTWRVNPAGMAFPVAGLEVAPNQYAAYFPLAAAADATGAVYILSKDLNSDYEVRISKITQGAVTVLATVFRTTPYPEIVSGLVIDPAGNLYFPDADRVVRV